MLKKNINKLIILLCISWTVFCRELPVKDDSTINGKRNSAKLALHLGTNLDDKDRFDPYKNSYFCGVEYILPLRSSELRFKYIQNFYQIDVSRYKLFSKENFGIASHTKSEIQVSLMNDYKKGRFHLYYSYIGAGCMVQILNDSSPYAGFYYPFQFGLGWEINDKFIISTYLQKRIFFVGFYHSRIPYGLGYEYAWPLGMRLQYEF